MHGQQKYVSNSIVACHSPSTPEWVVFTKRKFRNTRSP